MKKWFLSSTIVALLIALPAQATDFAPPTGEQTLVCTNPNVSEYPSAWAYCHDVVIPYVCNHWIANGAINSPLYMTLWYPLCVDYANEKLFPPPPPPT